MSPVCTKRSFLSQQDLTDDCGLLPKVRLQFHGHGYKYVGNDANSNVSLSKSHDTSSDSELPLGSRATTPR